VKSQIIALSKNRLHGNRGISERASQIGGKAGEKNHTKPRKREEGDEKEKTQRVGLNREKDIDKRKHLAQVI